MCTREDDCCGNCSECDPNWLGDPEKEYNPNWLGDDTEDDDAK